MKPWLASIGSNCKITSNVTILAHDYSRSVPRMVFHENVGGSAPVKIGDNVFIGMGTYILMGSTIGDDCIIGANSVVKGNFDGGYVIAGNPAKAICTIEEYIKKRKAKVVDEAVACVRVKLETTGLPPTVEEMGDGFAWLYLPRNEKIFDRYPHFFDLKGDIEADVKSDFMNSKGLWSSYDDFLSYAFEKIK